MLVIRQGQMKLLGASVRRRFEGEMAVHLHEFFPDLCAAMNRDDLAVFVQTTIDKALAYGIERERDVCKFLNVSMVFGKNFDERPEFSWSRDILADPLLVGPEKIDRLMKAALAIEARSSASHG